MDTTGQVDITGEGKLVFFGSSVAASLTVSGCYTYETSTTCSSASNPSCYSPPPKHLVGGKITFNFTCAAAIGDVETTLCSINDGRLCLGFGPFQNCAETTETLPWGDEDACG